MSQGRQTMGKSSTLNRGPVTGVDERRTVRTPMTDPTLTRVQGRGRRRGSSLLIAALAFLLVGAVGAAGLYGLTRPQAHVVNVVRASHGILANFTSKGGGPTLGR